MFTSQFIRDSLVNITYCQLISLLTQIVSSLASYDDIGISRGQKAVQGGQEARTRRMVEQIYGVDGFFCGPPGEWSCDGAVCTQNSTVYRTVKVF